jgi:hypothetical protein
MLVDFSCDWPDIRKQVDRCTGLIAEKLKDPKLTKIEREELQEKETLCCAILDLMTKLS